MKNKTKQTKSKKPASKTPKKPLVEVSPEQSFWMCDGQILKDLRELASSLEAMRQEVFQYHVNSQKNDFAKWVAEVLGEPELAKSLEKTKTPKAMAKKIKRKTG